MIKKSSVLCWMKLALPAFALLQVGACTTAALLENVQNEASLAASSAAFTIAETVLMNLLGV